MKHPRHPKRRRFKVEWVDKPVEKKLTFWSKFVAWFKKSFWDWSQLMNDIKRKAGRPKTPRKMPEPHRETIIVMMRYGGGVDDIAYQLGLEENDLIKYIKDSGLDKQLERRSWTWKAKRKSRRRIIK